MMMATQRSATSRQTRTVGFRDGSIDARSPKPLQRTRSKERNCTPQSPGRPQKSGGVTWSAVRKGTPWGVVNDGAPLTEPKVSKESRRDSKQLVNSSYHRRADKKHARAGSGTTIANPNVDVEDLEDVEDNEPPLSRGPPMDYQRHQAHSVRSTGLLSARDSLSRRSGGQSPSRMSQASTPPPLEDEDGKYRLEDIEVVDEYHLVEVVTVKYQTPPDSMGETSREAPDLGEGVQAPKRAWSKIGALFRLGGDACEHFDPHKKPERSALTPPEKCRYKALPGSKPTKAELSGKLPPRRTDRWLQNVHWNEFDYMHICDKNAPLTKMHFRSYKKKNAWWYEKRNKKPKDKNKPNVVTRIVTRVVETFRGIRKISKKIRIPTPAPLHAPTPAQQALDSLPEEEPEPMPPMKRITPAQRKKQAEKIKRQEEERQGPPKFYGFGDHPIVDHFPDPKPFSMPFRPKGKG